MSLSATKLNNVERKERKMNLKLRNESLKKKMTNETRVNPKT